MTAAQLLLLFQRYPDAAGMPVWPALLPLPQRAGNSRATVDTAARSSLDGPAQGRRRSHQVRQSCPVSWVMDDDRFALFDGYWHHTLAQGCAWCLLMLSGELGTQLHAARISGGYTADHASGLWQVSATLELADPPHLDADDLAALLALPSLSIDTEASALHVLVHTSIPSRILP